MKYFGFSECRFLFLLVATLSFSNASGSNVKQASVSGAELQYIEMGSGPLLILAHGAVSDHRRFQKDHLPKLAENYRVVSYTMRYHGNSEAWNPDWPVLSMDLYADDLADLIRELDSGPAHLVGWSMGARVAHTAALKYPDLVRSAYLYEGAAAMEKNAEDAKQAETLRNEFFGKSMAFLETNDFDAAAGALINAVVGKEGFFEKLPEPRQKAIGSKGKVLAAVFESVDKPISRYECDTIRESKVPTLLVVGENTAEYFSTAFAEHYAPCLSSEQIVRIPGANHVWPGGKVDDFVGSVHAFTSKH